MGDTWCQHMANRDHKNQKYILLSLYLQRCRYYVGREAGFGLKDLGVIGGRVQSGRLRRGIGVYGVSFARSERLMRGSSCCRVRHLDPQSMQNNGLVFSGFWTIVLPILSVQV